jgi:hypothetical protein
VNTIKTKKARAQEKTFTQRAKIALVREGITIKTLARKLRPRRPRSTVSKAINQNRFPLVRKQISEALGI